MRINRNKLTPFDLQILNLAALTPGMWRLDSDSMTHPDYGTFTKSRLGMQASSSKANTPQYRELSWRGRILMHREWRRMLSAVVEQPPAAAAQASVAMQAPMGGMTAMGMAALQQAAQPSLLQQMERAQRQLLDQAITGRSGLGSLSSEQRGIAAPPPKNDLVDSFSYLTSAGVSREQIKLLVDTDVVAKGSSAG
jgi:hypothetical protein